MTVWIFLVLLAIFTVVAIWISYKNDFSGEIENILFTAIGAIAVATYFMISTFLVAPQKEYSFKVSVPVMWDPATGKIFSPYRKTIGNLPEETAMFRGLDEYNSRLHYDVLQNMDVWGRLANRTTNDLRTVSSDRLSYLEYVFLAWVEQSVNWLKLNEEIQYSHNGYGAGASILEATPQRAIRIRLDSLQSANQFILQDPLLLTVPSGGRIERKADAGSITLKIRTNTGEYEIRFQDSTGGVFDPNISTVLTQKMAEFAREHFPGGILPTRLWADYPVISINYRSFSSSQFSKQAKGEFEWLHKIHIQLYKDFSWDLLREYYSFGYHASLQLYREHFAKTRESKTN
ncbi:hypothetical protein AZI85_01600 [Bdellovibrio bacteriovorus]|uniref:Uncharacterized protein n=1 Tax=Bdellovibrio bacteriovorus TaxID=959 RepID=A0A150WVX4_BDEBC|nr:hypothetical protein [Bdellovibrio bacteriovorus]KYG70658.1 hypothetical protein AZI85_01600 [Bdellovibrio bacteriovorus]